MKNEYTYLKGLIEKAGDDITVVASDETVDRSGESIPAESWDLETFKSSPRLLADHDYRVEAIIGRAEDIRIDGKKLLFRPVFHEITELARNVKEMVVQGMLDTVSVGFLRKSDGEATRNELMEISFVAVPANPSARVLAVKSITPDEAKALEAFVAKEGEKPEGAADPAPTGKPEDAPEAQNAPVAAPEPQAEPDIEKAPEPVPDVTPAADPDAPAKGMPAEKAGRVISEKNRAIIQASLDAMGAATSALTDLLDMAEPSQGGEKSATATADTKRSNAADGPYAELEAYVEKRRVIRGVATALSEALSQLKFERTK